MKINNKYLSFILILLLIQIFFEIFFFYNYVLPGTDTIFQYEKLKNLIKYGSAHYDFYPGSTYGWDKYDLYEFFTVLSNKLLYVLLDLNLSLNNFIYFETSIKLIILLIIFIIFLNLFKSKKITLIFFSLLFVDGSFTHTLHNVHHYLILTLSIVFIISNKNFFGYKKKLFLFLSGLFLTYGSISIVVSGVIIGTTLIIYTLYLFKKKILRTSDLACLYLGCLMSILLYLNFNYENIINQLNDTNLTNTFNKDLYYKIKYNILNIYYLVFGQHGNNFILIYVIYLFYFSSEIEKKIDKHLFNIITIYLLIFFLFSIVIDPLHYYPSRIGIITPFVLYLLFKINLKVNIFKYNKINIITCSLVILSLSANLVQIFEIQNRYENFFFNILISLPFFLFYFFLKKKNFFFKYFLFVFFICISLKFFPHYKLTNIMSNFSAELSNSINKSLQENIKMNETNCIITNYPNSDRFSDVNLFNINASGEHLNKKSAYGIGSCQNLVFFVDNKTNKEFLPSKKIMYLKNLEFEETIKNIEFFFFRDNYYEIRSIKTIENIKIYYSYRTDKKIFLENNVLHLSYY